MSDSYKVNESLPTTDKIEALNDMIMALDGQIDQTKFNKEEIAELYSGAGFERKYLRDVSLGHTLDDYTDWSHELSPETGYNIWKIAPDNYEYDAKNQLYFDNKVLTNKGEASTESASTFNLVYLYNGSSYIDDTTEAGTEAGTPFSLMTGASSFLYLGFSTTFKGAKFEFNTRGSNYDNSVEIYATGASSAMGSWIGLTANVDDYEDDTSDFESDGNISWNLAGTGASWLQTAVNTQTKYWARIKTTTVPVTTAKANYIIPSSSVIGLLALSSSEILNEEWAWCTYSTDIYVTIRNTGAAAYEGDYYITSSSSPTNLQNFFIYNHEYKLDHLDDRFDYLSSNLCEEDIEYELEGTGAGSALYSGSRGYIMHPNTGTIKSYYLLADISGDLVVDVKKGTYTNFPTLTSITGTQKPTLTSAQKSYGTNLSTWTTSITKNDILKFDVNQATTVRKATLILQILKS